MVYLYSTILKQGQFQRALQRHRNALEILNVRNSIEKTIKTNVEIHRF